MYWEVDDSPEYNNRDHGETKVEDGANRSKWLETGVSEEKSNEFCVPVPRCGLGNVNDEEIYLSRRESVDASIKETKLVPKWVFSRRVTSECTSEIDLKLRNGDRIMKKG